MNILITSAGRQVFLVNAFKEALGEKGKVFTSDIDKDAPALEASDIGFISPAFTDENYIEWVIDTCRRCDINLLITLNVDDLLILEKHRDKLSKEEVFLVGGDIQKIKKTYDKYELSQFCSEIGINVPKTCLIGDKEIEKLNYPILAKPRFGKGSKGHQIINSKSELNSFTKSNSSSDYILQEYLPGQEFGLDLVNDFESKYAGVLVRKKFAMKNGETYEAVTESPKEWIQLARKLSMGLKHQGTIDIDVILFEGVKYVIDINHRFGGGYIFNHVSGAHVPKAYFQWFQVKNNLDIASRNLSYNAGIHSKREALSIK